MRKFVLVAVLVLFPMSYANAQIPSDERNALLTLYNATNGIGWTDNSGWSTGAVGTECTWYGVTCVWGRVQGLDLESNQLIGSIPQELGNLSSLEILDLYFNRLRGSIPTELGDLPNLQKLDLGINNLEGGIPPKLGDLSSLAYLSLNSNHLSGGIPPELGNLSKLKVLVLMGNGLRGNIPAQLGNLSSLEFLYLSGNLLSGSIPTDLENLSTLRGGLGVDLAWNALHSNNASLIAFLNSKQPSGDWQRTQTIAPANLTVGPLGDHTVWLSWDAASYQSDPGGYEVFSAPTGTGVWTSAGWTEAKTDTTFPVAGLDPGSIFDFAVVSYTDPHLYNLNLVNSELSPEVMATTAAIGCAQPIIEIAWGDPTTLSVSGSYGTHLWITGETTSNINVDPLFSKWYWVTVTSTGPCEETAAALVPGTAVFFDGFEIGDTVLWSNTVP